jgi:4-hydroxy-4-methyl-2-oxoglutarate aldolase
MSETATDAARGHSAATVYEASAGMAHACDPALRAVWPGARVAGPAFVVLGVGGDNLALHRAVTLAPVGSVLVVDLQGARYVHWGEILAAAARQRGILGLVVDGGVRDVAEQAEVGFPVFARHVTVVGTAKEHPGRLDVPVRVGGAAVEQGDLIVGDADGVIVVPATAVAGTLDRADARAAAEQRALTAIREGISTVEYYRLPGADSIAGELA